MGGNPNDPLTTTNSNTELIMADANHKAVDDVSVRILTVSKKRQPWPCPVGYPINLPHKPDCPDVPGIRLCGQWLEKAGFAIASKARVEVSEGKLVITPA